MKHFFALSTLILMLLSFSAYPDAGAQDHKAGEQAYNTHCASCHGKAGNQPILPTYPKLGGQNALYLVKQIKDFQSGKRKDPSMNAMANLIRGKEQAVANYLAAQ